VTERIDTTATIQAPVDVVFDVLADPSTHAAIDGTGWTSAAGSGATTSRRPARRWRALCWRTTGLPSRRRFASTSGSRRSPCSTWRTHWGTWAIWRRRGL